MCPQGAEFVENVHFVDCRSLETVCSAVYSFCFKMSDHEKTLNPLQTAIAISKKLNNFETIQAMAVKLERIFRDYLGTLFLKSSSSGNYVFQNLYFFQSNCYMLYLN